MQALDILTLKTDIASDSSVKSDSEKPDSTIDQSGDDYDLNECKDINCFNMHAFLHINFSTSK